MATLAPEQLLSPDDLAFLREKQVCFEAEQVGALVHVVVHEYALPQGYRPSVVDLLLRLPVNFPLAAPDMFWTDPEVRLSSGGYPAASSHFEEYGGRRWQRWSRHFAQAWRVGTDNLRTFWGSIRRELQKGI